MCVFCFREGLPPPPVCLIRSEAHLCPDSNTRSPRAVWAVAGQVLLFYFFASALCRIQALQFTSTDRQHPPFLLHRKFTPDYARYPFYPSHLLIFSINPLPSALSLSDNPLAPSPTHPIPSIPSIHPSIHPSVRPTDWLTTCNTTNAFHLTFPATCRESVSLFPDDIVTVITRTRTCTCRMSGFGIELSKIKESSGQPPVRHWHTYIPVTLFILRLWPIVFAPRSPQHLRIFAFHTRRHMGHGTCIFRHSDNSTSAQSSPTTPSSSLASNINACQRFLTQQIQKSRSKRHIMIYETMTHGLNHTGISSPCLYWSTYACSLSPSPFGFPSSLLPMPALPIKSLPRTRSSLSLGRFIIIIIIILLS